ncbi:hypothetical protein EYF80_005263 [Liparis tanakae]|uniref:Uncharacterized protein n=1 Tax=Liparis tanakae TaxID=230148 RepID=A0A4Z2J4Y4_9TELE|nr:hypothetical protein EYF80_005263 [Liparis tanakae]
MEDCLNVVQLAQGHWECMSRGALELRYHQLVISEPTFNKRMAVIQQVLVCSSSAQSNFKSRAELPFVDWREKMQGDKRSSAS